MHLHLHLHLYSAPKNLEREIAPKENHSFKTFNFSGACGVCYIAPLTIWESGSQSALLHHSPIQTTSSGNSRILGQFGTTCRAKIFVGNEQINHHLQSRCLYSQCRCDQRNGISGRKLHFSCCCYFAISHLKDAFFYKNTVNPMNPSALPIDKSQLSIYVDTNINK